MIAFGSAITKPEVFRRCAKPGIERVREPDSLVVELPAVGSTFASYNAILDRVRDREDLEALVLVHQDAEIVTGGFCGEVRRLLADPDVGLAGCAGAVGVRSIAWWEGSVTCASFLHRYEELGGGDVPAASWDWTDAPAYARLGEVETLDGFLLVLSPWAVRELRFDESLGQLHGYDLDFCCQVRAAGRKVVTGLFHAIHNHALEPFSDPEEWIAAHVRIAEKWDGRLPGIGAAPGDWRERALRAEAEADAARLADRSNVLQGEARVRELERALEETTTSLSWRLTAPLRRVRRARRAP
jgi:hypothetical protein